MDKINSKSKMDKVHYDFKHKINSVEKCTIQYEIENQLAKYCLLQCSKS